jgi:hypothetical protein
MLAYGGALIVLEFAFYGFFFTLWVDGQQALYRDLVWAYGVAAEQWLFLDLEVVLSWAECHRLGYDVMSVNPCDVYGRLSLYSPLLPLLPLRMRDLFPLGVALDALYFVVVALVLRPASFPRLVLSAVVALSTASFFAVDRANLDVLVFILGALAAWCSVRSAKARLVGYALLSLAGLLKFYPFAALITLLREGERRALAIGGIVAAGLAILGAEFWADLVRVPSLMPRLPPYHDVYGISIFGFGAAQFFALPDALVPLLTAPLLVAALAAAIWFYRSVIREPRLIDWDGVDMRLLLVGATFVVACFFASNNVGYRQILLILCVPGLIQIRRATLRAGTRIAMTVALAALIYRLCEMSVEQVINFVLDSLGLLDLLQNTFGILTWVLRELAWWWMVAIFAAFIAHFATHSTLYEGAAGRWFRRPPLSGRAAG